LFAALVVVDVVIDEVECVVEGESGGGDEGGDVASESVVWSRDGDMLSELLRCSAATGAFVGGAVE
jgi:hypothetical protein